MRSATRRLVLARRLSLITPAGRCVARIRCSPSDRPRWATSTTPSTNSGTSSTSAANSSTTMTRLGGRLRVPGRLQLEQVLGLLAVAAGARGSAARRRSEVSARRTRCGLRSVTRPTRVRQVDAVGERRAALVVDEEERDPLRAVGRRHARAPRSGGTRSCPAPVVPPTSAWGPWVRRSRCNGSCAGLADERPQRHAPRRLRRRRSRRRPGWAASPSAATAPPRPSALGRAPARASARNDTAPGRSWLSSTARRRRPPAPAAGRSHLASPDPGAPHATRSFAGPTARPNRADRPAPRGGVRQARGNPGRLYGPPHQMDTHGRPVPRRAAPPGRDPPARRLRPARAPRGARCRGATPRRWAATAASSWSSTTRPRGSAGR